MIIIIHVVIMSCFIIGAELTLVSQPQVSQTYYCPGPVTFTCMATELTSGILVWQVNGSTAASYAFIAAHRFPHLLTIISPLVGVMAEITSVSANPNVANTFDIFSVLNASDVSILKSTSLQCASSYSTSNRLMVGVNPLGKVFFSLRCTLLIPHCF